MAISALLLRLKSSLLASAGTIVFGMEDGTVSIFGLVFGVAATTSSSAAVVVAGASGAIAAAVSMMAGAYLDAETNRDERTASLAHLKTAFASDSASIAALLSKRLKAARLTTEQITALAGAVRHNPEALKDLLLALQTSPEEALLNPVEQALWMLLADFLSAAVPMLPFFLIPVSQARIVSAVVTITLLVALGLGRARIAGRAVARTVAETVSIGVAAAAAGVAIGLLIDRNFHG